MQETRNNCFGSKKRSKTLRQAKTGKHERRNVTATVLLLPETIIAGFLHFIVLLFKVLSNHSSKRQFLMLHCCISIVSLNLAKTYFFKQKSNVRCLENEQ